ncbi:MAG: SCO family protein [Ktedonobacteraceae bacterium]
MRISWRLASRFSVITLALLVVIIVAFWSARPGNGGASATSPNPLGLQGTDLGSQLAPDFHLTDQFNQPVALSQFRGQPVVLTFLYTHCPDACPLIAEKLHTTQVQLGKDASHVVMLAVSMDPTGDTKASVLAFSQAHKLNSNWHYLLGTHEQLAPVWNAYSIYAQPTATKVTHTSAIYLIDAEGHERIFFSDDFTSTQLTNDLKILLNGE